MKKWILGGLVVLLLLLALPVIAIGSAFLGNAPLEHGRTYAADRVVTVKDGYVACFLVDVGGGRYVLIDACQDPEARGVQAALEERGAALSDISMILLTHGHTDHVGGVEALPRVPVRAMAAELPFLQGEQAYQGPVTRLVGKTDTGIDVRAPLADGATFRVGDTAFEAFHVPGHTPGSAAYLAHGVLFLGDSAGYKGDHLVGAPWVFSGDTDQNVEALRSLADQLASRSDEVDWLAPAHTGPAGGLEPLADL